MYFFSSAVTPHDTVVTGDRERASREPEKKEAERERECVCEIVDRFARLVSSAVAAALQCRCLKGGQEGRVTSTMHKKHGRDLVHA